MENMPLTSTSVPRAPARRVRGRLVVALAATVALWPALGAVGLSDLTLAAVVLPVTALTWVAVLGLLDAPRPVLTGTLAGLLYGAVLVALSLAFGHEEPRPTFVVLFAAGWELTWGALLGAGAGLLGSGVQQLRGRRP
ncbi:hypothetical protein [Cellulomonas xiejunii]|uniref:Uncharacterized protein n=1 Tax=Cellulomonas xiejunii TaxID=2968083 RepID=A0ABY5KNZ6_9CELL|nr:hypothetical protein [Cellulomonas xiejunii]MCC2320905.1 hypothetical protein [Cellulomonas xiejunii]UUI71186.1 hypothetical protein NP048_15520 [Cellulomonas xiejunii]